MIIQSAVNDYDWALLAFYMSCLNHEEKAPNTLILKAIVSHKMSFPGAAQGGAEVEAAYPQLPE